MSLEDLDEGTRDELAALANKLANDPATRKDFLKLAKKSTPELTFPELEMEQTLEATVKPFKEKIETLENKLREKDITDRVLNNRQKLVKDGLASEADIPEIEKLMIEKKIPDHNTAAEFYRLQKEAARPTPGRYTPPTNPINLKEIGKNPKNWARNEAMKAIDELARNRNH